MTIGEAQKQLRQIVLDDHPLTSKQRMALQKAIVALDAIKALRRGTATLGENMKKDHGDTLLDFPLIRAVGDP